MEINTYYLHVAIFGLVVVYFYFRFIAAHRERASFRMYKVRDDFIYLVASEVMTETDPVFSYYYKRINKILSIVAPTTKDRANKAPVGIDDLLHVLFNDPTNLDKELEKTKKRVDQILASDSAQNEDVKRIIENYYLSLKYIMLSHSSILRVVFLVTKHLNPIKILFEHLVPKSNPIGKSYKVTKYVEREACELHGGRHPC